VNDGEKNPSCAHMMLLFIGLRENQTNDTVKKGSGYGKEIFLGADMPHWPNNFKWLG
jgi:hypothetical protein